MKILYHHRIASKDGQFVHLDAIVSALRAAGHEVDLVGPQIVQDGEFGSDGGFLSRVRAAVPHWLGEVLELSYNFIAFPRVLWAALRNRPEFIYERYNLFALAGVWTSRIVNRPLIVEVNAPLVQERTRHGDLQLRGIAGRCEAYVWRKADAILPVTGVLAEHVIAAGAHPDRIVVIPNGCDEKLLNVGYREARDSPFPDGAVILGFCGFLRAWHGLERVLEVMAQEEHSRTCFLVVGDGPAREDLERRAVDLGLAERLHVTGTVTHQDIPSYVSLFDIALQPDVVDYASPLKLFDYIAVGCAIVAPDKQNIREILTHGETAWLFKSDDLERFQGAITGLLDDAGLTGRLGQAARAEAMSRGLTWTANARRIVEIATRLLNGCQPGSGAVADASKSERGSERA